MQEVEIPGGTAVMFDKQAELSPRRRRPIELVTSRIGRKVELMSKATRIICDTDVVVDHSEERNEDGTPKFTGGDIDVTERELGLMMRLNDVMALALLKEWTIEHPLPRTEDEFGEIPIDVYDALRKHAAKINAAFQEAGDQFGPDAIEVPDSPTGD